MRFLELHAENFLSIGELHLDLSRFRGLTSITGANGSGKSAIFEALSYALYGRLLRKSSRGPDVSCRFSNGHPRVFVKLETGDGRTLEITRRRTSRGPSLEVSGLSGLSTVSGMQESLESMLAMDFELFRRAVVFSGDTSSFCRLSDSDRKSLLEDLLGVGYFIRASALAAEALKELTIAHDGLEHRISVLSENLDGNRNFLSRMEKDIEENMRAYRANYAKSLHAIDRCAGACEAAVRTVLDTLTRLLAQEEELKALRAKHDAHVKELQDRLKTAREVANNRRDARVRVEAEMERIAEELADLESGKHPDVCPTCKRPWPQDVKHADDLIAAKKRVIANLKEALASARAQEARAAMDAAACERELGEVIAGIPSADSLQREYADAVRNLESNETRLTIAKNDLRALRAARRCTGNAKALARLRRTITAQEEELRGLQDKLKKSRAEMSLARFWKDAFSKHGIPSALLTNAMPTLNSAVADYLRHLTDGCARVSFSVSEGNFGIDVEYANGGGTYADTSKGEHTRVDVAILLAIRRLMEGRLAYAWSQIFMDETFDGLDAEGVEAVMKLMRREFKDRQVFIISHDETIKGLADNTLRVYRRGGFTQVDVG